MLNNLSGYLQVGTRGIALLILPNIIKGIMNEAMTAQKVDVHKAIEWVNNDEHLWGHVGLADNQAIRNIVKKLGIEKFDDRWITVSWLLEGIRKQHPTIYSLMMGWPDGYAWCEQQVIEIKAELAKLTRIIPASPFL